MSHSILRILRHQNYRYICIFPNHRKRKIVVLQYKSTVSLKHAMVSAGIMLTKEIFVKCNILNNKCH